MNFIMSYRSIVADLQVGNHSFIDRKYLKIGFTSKKLKPCYCL